MVPLISGNPQTVIIQDGLDQSKFSCPRHPELRAKAFESLAGARPLTRDRVFGARTHGVLAYTTEGQQHTDRAVFPSADTPSEASWPESISLSRKRAVRGLS